MIIGELLQDHEHRAKKQVNVYRLVHQILKKLCKCMCMLTPVAMWTRGGQKAALSSGTCPVEAADEALSWLQLPEEFLSAESKCSSWLSGLCVPLHTGTVGCNQRSKHATTAPQKVR